METTTGYCETVAGRLYFERKGAGRSFTFCNGTAMDRRIWDEQFDVFAESFQVLRFDNLGCGKSSDLPDKPHRYHEDLSTLHDFLGISNSIVGGLSVGGGIALNYCFHFPERVSTLILMDTFITGYHWPHMSTQLKTLSGFWQYNDVNKTVETWLALDWFAHMKRNSEKYQKTFDMVEENARRFFSTQFPPKVDWGPTMVERLGQISVPVLLLVGEFDTPDNHEVMRIIKDKVPQAKLIVVPDSGHAVNVENAPFVNKTIIDFLNESNFSEGSGSNPHEHSWC